MMRVPYILHIHLKFKHKGNTHTMETNLEPYALCKLADMELEDIDIHHINLFDVPP